MTRTEFEDLIIALAREADRLVDVRRHGDSGQRQDGVDVIGFTPDDRHAHAYQCNRVASFTESDLARAVAEFAGGTRPSRPVRFVIAVAAPARRAQVMHRLIKERIAHPDFALELWDAPTLSDLLRARSRIVEQFFGREAARDFC